MINIVSVNVRGLQNNKKRKELFLYFKKMKYDIVLMQETHSEKCNETIWSSEFGSKIYFSHGDSKSRGAAIVFKPDLNVEIVRETNSEIGRYVILDIKIHDKVFTIANVYAPNDDAPGFFTEFFQQIEKHTAADKIIGGDLNLVLEEEKDSVNRKNNNNKSLSIIQAFCEQAMMVDPWRIHNPDKFEFTWANKVKAIYARLDYILTNFALVSNIKSIVNVPAYKTDHNAVKLEIELNKESKRGPGFWKHNDSLLQKMEYVNAINVEIENALTASQNYDAGYKWEYLKGRIVKKCQEESKKRPKNSSKKYS